MFFTELFSRLHVEDDHEDIEVSEPGVVPSTCGRAKIKPSSGICAKQANEGKEEDRIFMEEG